MTKTSIFGGLAFVGCLIAAFAITWLLDYKPQARPMVPSRDTSGSHEIRLPPKTGGSIAPPSFGAWISTLRNRLTEWCDADPAGCIRWCDEHFINDLTPEIVERGARLLKERKKLATLCQVLTRLEVTKHRKIVGEHTRDTFARLAEDDPSAALEALRRFDPVQILEYGFSGLYDEMFVRWLRADLTVAVERAVEFEESDDLRLFSGSFQRAIQTEGRKGNLELLNELLATEIPDSLASKIYGSIANGIKGRDPATAYRFAEKANPVWSYIGMQQRTSVLEAMAQEDLAQALATASQLPPARRDAILSTIARDEDFDGDEFIRIAREIGDPNVRAAAFVSRFKKDDPEQMIPLVASHLTDPYDQILAARIIVEQAEDRSALRQQLANVPEGRLRDALEFNLARYHDNGE